MHASLIICVFCTNKKLLSSAKDDAKFSYGARGSVKDRKTTKPYFIYTTMYRPDTTSCKRPLVCSVVVSGMLKSGVGSLFRWGKIGKPVRFLSNYLYCENFIMFRLCDGRRCWWILNCIKKTFWINEGSLIASVFFMYEFVCIKNWYIERKIVYEFCVRKISLLCLCIFLKYKGLF